MHKIPDNRLNSLRLIAHSHAVPSAHPCNCPTLSSTDCIRYLGILVDSQLTFKPHISATAGRLRKLMFVFRNLRQAADPGLVRTVYLALCQSLITYCITSWGGACKSVLIRLERAQRAVLKVCTFKPLIFPTFKLYQYCEVLTVRQLFILSTVLKQHRDSVYEPSQAKSRRNHLIAASSLFRTVFSHRFFCFLGPFLYNRLHRELDIYSLTSFACKKILTNFLQARNYAETENIISPCR